MLFLQPIDWDSCYASLQVDRTVKEVGWATPGTTSGLAVLEEFIQERLKFFGTDRNNPNKTALSNLSPWFHFGKRTVESRWRHQEDSHTACPAAFSV